MAALAILAVGWVAAPAVARANPAGETLRQLFDDWNAAMAKEDADAAAAIWAQDSLRIHPMGEFKGRSGQRDLYVALIKDYADEKCTITWIAAEGNKAAVGFTWEATDRKSGKHIALPIAMLADLDGAGKIKWAHEVFDTGAFAKQLQ